MKQLISQLILLSLIPAFALAESNSCVCDCVYVKTSKIRSHNYFESNTASCVGIEGKACIGTHRGQSFRGTISDCQAGPRDLSTGIGAELTSSRYPQGNSESAINRVSLKAGR